MKKKILLMGRSGCGKTSMRALVFSSSLYPTPDSTRRLGTTLGMETSHFRFLKNLVISLYDMGGQQAYVNDYLDDRKDQVFKDVGSFVYVFDMGNVQNSGDEDEGWEGDFRYWRDCVRLLKQHSPGAKVVCLLHKMDLVDSSRRREVYAERVKELGAKARDLGVSELSCYGTSIWDETLYRAWSRLIHELIPNIQLLEENLTQFAKIATATEAVIFERTTFLVIARSGGMETTAMEVANDQTATAAQSASTNKKEGQGSSGPSKVGPSNRHSSASDPPPLSQQELTRLMSGYPPTEAERKSLLDKGQLHPERFEKISEMVKNLRGSCNKLDATFQSFEVRGATFQAYLDVFTSNTYILVIVADPKVELSTIKRNVQRGRERFEKLG